MRLTRSMAVGLVLTIGAATTAAGQPRVDAPFWGISGDSVVAWHDVVDSTVPAKPVFTFEGVSTLGIGRDTQVIVRPWARHTPTGEWRNSLLQLSLRHQIVDRLQDLLFFGRLEIHETGDHVGQARRRVHALNRRGKLRGRIGQELQGVERALLELMQARVDVRAVHGGFIDALHPRDEIRISVEEFDDAEALLPLADQVMAAVGRGQVAQNRRGRTDLVEIGAFRVGDFGIALQNEANGPLRARRFLRGGDRPIAANADRQHDARKQHHVAHRDDDHRVGRQRRARTLTRLSRGRSGDGLLATLSLIARVLDCHWRTHEKISRVCEARASHSRFQGHGGSSRIAPGEDRSDARTGPAESRPDG